MNHSSLPSDDQHSEADFPRIIRGRDYQVLLTQCLVGGFVLAALVTAAIPALSQISNRGAQTKALSQAKQVGLSLKLFAGDNNGIYPKDGVPAALHAPSTSNAALAVLLPTYTESETIFGNPLSAYQHHLADNVIDNPYTGKPVHTLEAGENVYAYVMGLEDTFNPSCPLIADGTDGTGHYVSDPTKRGGLWGGTEAIVIRLDNSGQLEKLAGPPEARYIPMGSLGNSEEFAGSKLDDNLLSVSRFGAGVRLLDPAIAADK